MLWGAGDGGGLELRRESDGGVRLSGRFPYGKAAVLSDGGKTGKPRKEMFVAGAFAYRVDTPSSHDGGPKEIHLLVGHDYGKPLASVRAGTLKLRDTAAALIFSAMVTPQIAATQHGRDALALLDAGLQTGISPGFRIPPERAVAEAETVEQEPDDGRPSPLDGQPQRGALIRVIKEALLYELSVVTRAAYPLAQVEARSWTPAASPKPVFHPANRWR